MKEKNRQRRLRLVAEAKKKPAVFTVYIILRLIVVAILVSSILRGEKEIGINLNGITVLNDTMTKEEMFRSIENADIIFLMGGDTLKQNDFLMKNDLKPIIKTFKKVVIGISAGAINLSNISLCSKDEEDGVEKTITYEGIGRINYTIEPHFDIDNKILLQNELYPLSEKMTIYGLPNNTGVRIIDSNFEILYGDFYTIYKKSVKNII